MKLVSPTLLVALVAVSCPEHASAWKVPSASRPWFTKTSTTTAVPNKAEKAPGFHSLRKTNIAANNAKSLDTKSFAAVAPLAGLLLAPSPALAISSSDVMASLTTMVDENAGFNQVHEWVADHLATLATVVNESEQFRKVHEWFGNHYDPQIVGFCAVFSFFKLIEYFIFDSDKPAGQGFLGGRSFRRYH